MLYIIAKIFLLTLTFSNVVHLIRNFSVYKALNTESVELLEAVEMFEKLGSKYIVLRCFYNLNNLLIDNTIVGIKRKRCSVIEIAPGVSYVYGRLKVLENQIIFTDIKVIFTADKKYIKEYLNSKYRKEYILCGLFIILMEVLRNLQIVKFLN